MARFYREFVERIIVALILLMQVEKENTRETILKHLQKHKGSNPNEDDLIYRSISHYFDARPNDENYIANEEVLAAALSQMQKTKQHDTDLIETIVRALQLPHSAHYFHLGHLKVLRDAILRPEELTKWKKGVLESNLKCKCGHQFENYESIVTRSAGDGTMEFQCHKCNRPQRVACDICGESFSITEKINYNAKVQCGCHLKKKAEAAVAAATGAPVQAPPPPRARAPRAAFRTLMDDPLMNRLYPGGAIQWTATEATPTPPVNDDGGF